MNKEYTLRAKNVNIEVEKSKVIADINQRIGARQDFKVMIQPLDFRSGGQLKAYWCLVTIIQTWMIKEGNFYLRDEWKIIYNVSNRDSLSDYIKIQAGHYNKKWNEILILTKDMASTTAEWLIEPKSIANNSDCTREDMKGIIEWILNFAADMVIPECKIKDTELENMLKSYER